MELEQEKAIAESYHLSKQRSFPVTYIDGTCVIGFHESRLRQLLKLPSQKEEHESIKLEERDVGGGFSLEDKEHQEAIQKMREWLLREAESHGYTINHDEKVVEEILVGLAKNERRYGYKACPCRLATGKYQLDCDIVCPCSYCFWTLKRTAGVIARYLYRIVTFQAAPLSPSMCLIQGKEVNLEKREQYMLQRKFPRLWLKRLQSRLKLT